MKINEKNMVAFATSATPVDREGWLNKRGEINRGYQRRWFILKGNILFYFDRRGDKEPVGMIVLEGCTIELAEDEEQFGFKIVFHGPNNRSYVLAAESQVKILLYLRLCLINAFNERQRYLGVYGTVDESIGMRQL